MKFGKKEVKVTLYCMGIVIALLVFQFVFSPQQNKNQELDTEIVALESQIAQLQKKVEKQSEYETKTEEMKQKMQNVLVEFPAKLQEEDGIIYATKLEANSDIKISNVGLSQGSAIYEIGASSQSTTQNTKENNQEGKETTEVANQTSQGGKVLYNAPITIDYTISYGGLKKCINYINEDSKRKSIQSISCTYDSSTGLMIGNLVVNTYYITGTDAVYERPEIPGMSTGVNNIFGTLEPTRTK